MRRRGQDLAGAGIQHGDSRFAPKAGVQPVAAAIEGEAERVGPLDERLRNRAVVGGDGGERTLRLGGGGLGVFIFRGLAMADTNTILAGAVPAAIMALIADEVLEWIQRKLSPA